MARKRSLKDTAADQLVEKNEAVPEAAAPAGEVARTPAARRTRARAARKRSLKDAAADQLVEKNEAVPEPAAPVVDEVKAPVAEPSEAAATPEATPAPKSAQRSSMADEPAPAREPEKKGRPSVKWVAILILIGFLAGFFFGVGRAIGPANLAFILFGFAGGYLFRQFYKILP